ncbi:MAG: hypothetical protein JWL76_2125 [Thermoleophilia bacterium]|nr:hypothetical protein [Thermoleophilia bacterium]
MSKKQSAKPETAPADEAPVAEAAPVEAPAEPAPADDAAAEDAQADADAPAEDDELAAASITITGPQSALITGDAAFVAASMDAVREHGGQLEAADGSTVHGPITGENVSDDGLTARIMVAFPIAPAPSEQPADDA